MLLLVSCHYERRTAGLIGDGGLMNDTIIGKLGSVQYLKLIIRNGRKNCVNKEYGYDHVHVYDHVHTHTCL